MTRRLLVVNADDFGQSAGINRGIIEAFKRGIVTSASLMVRHPGAGEAAAYARAHGLDLGLHVDLGEWMYAEERWTALYEVVPLDDGAGIAGEVERQLDRFRELVGGDPTHIDSHQHVHGRSPAREVFVAIADRLRVPLRGVTPGVRYCGDFYGQTAEGGGLPDAITSEALLRILRGLAGGCTELGCHPGHDDGLLTMYRTERAQEVATLCDPRVRQTIVALGIELCSFDELDKPVTDVR